MHRSLSTASVCELRIWLVESGSMGDTQKERAPISLRFNSLEAKIMAQFRGVYYDLAANGVEVTEQETTCQYRGASFKLRAPKGNVVQSRISGLKYRGAEVR